MTRKLTGTKQNTVSDKLQITNSAEQHAEQEFGVSKSNVRLWQKSKENFIVKRPWLITGTNSGKKAAWPALKTDLLGKKQWSNNSTMACAIESPRNGKG